MSDRIPLPSTSDMKKVLDPGYGALPGFPGPAAGLLGMPGREGASAGGIAGLVQSDPGIAARVLDWVNTAGPEPQGTAATLSQAVDLAGAEEIGKLGFAAAVLQSLFSAGRTGGLDPGGLRRHCLCVAALSMEVAKRARHPHPEHAYAAGMLHDAGKILLDRLGRRNYAEFLRDAAPLPASIADQERKALGLGHDDVGALLCSQWGLPDSVVIAVKYHHRRLEAHNFSEEESLLAWIVSLSNSLCRMQGLGALDTDTDRPLILSPEVWERIDFQQMDLIACINAMHKEMGRIFAFHQVAFPAPGRLQDDLIRSILQLSKANTGFLYKGPAPGMHYFRRAGDTVFPGPEFELGTALAKAKTIKEILDVLMFRIGSIFEPVHWSLLLKEPKTGDMVHAVVEGVHKEKLQGSRLAKGEGFAGRLLETGAGLLVEDVSSRPNQGAGEFAGLEARSCMGALLKSESAIFGVIELVNKIKGGGFTQEEFELLQSIAEHAAMAMERVYYQQALKKMAATDSLTGLKNRHSLERVLSNREKVLKDFGPDVSLMIVDIDKFKRINETRGRRKADELLQSIAGILKATFRKTDHLFRYEADKFVALLPGTDGAAAARAKARILDSFAAGKGDMDATISIFAHTVSTDRAGGLIPFLEERIAGDKTGTGRSAEDAGRNLQPFVEQELQKQEPRPKVYRKKVSLDGQFVHLATKAHGYIRVEEIALFEIGFFITSGQFDIKAGDFLDISFHLDDVKWSFIERRVIVREVKDETIDAEFFNPPPYAKDLGFYLMG